MEEKSGFEIKPFGASEVEKLRELLLEARKIDRKFDPALKEPEEIVEKLIEWMKRKLASPNAFLFVALHNQKPIGYVFGWIERKSKNYWKIWKQGYICDIFVREEFRRKGAGSALLERAEKWFRERNVKMITAEIYAGNSVSLNFHRARDFEEYYVVMRKFLPEHF